jgi:hypothetical protein
LNLWIYLDIWYDWTNCALGLYPSSGVSRTNKIEELKIIDKISQYTRPQTNHTRVNY